MTREYTNALLGMIDEGLLDAELVVTACLKFMSEDAVKAMMHANEFVIEEEEGDE